MHTEPKIQLKPECQHFLTLIVEHAKATDLKYNKFS